MLMAAPMSQSGMKTRAPPIAASESSPPEPSGNGCRNRENQQEDRKLVRVRIPSSVDADPHVDGRANEPERNEDEGSSDRCFRTLSTRAIRQWLPEPRKSAGR